MGNVESTAETNFRNKDQKDKNKTEDPRSTEALKENREDEWEEMIRYTLRQVVLEI
jgi:hypothetical protein